MPLEHPLHRHGDGARFLGHDHNHRVAVFAHAHARPVAGAQIRAEPVAAGKGQHTARRRYPAVPDDHGSIVEGGLGEEDVADQLLGNLSVNGGAGAHILLQPGLPGKDDQRAHLLPAHDLAGGHGLGDDAVHLLLGLGNAQQASQPDGTQSVQHPPQLRLEQDHHRQQSHRQELVEDIAEGVQMRRLGDPGNHDHHQHSPRDAHGTGGINQRKKFVYQKRHQQNIQVVRPLHSGQLVNKTLNGLHKCTFPFYVNFTPEHTGLSYSNLLSVLL